MKHIPYFDTFLSDHVNLNQTRLDTLTSRVKTITSLLKDKLDGYQKYRQQGSYAHQTIIKPVKENDEFDADILVFIKDENFDLHDFTDYVKKVFDVLKEDNTYTDKVTKETRCVTIDYAEDFQLDIVPCIEHNNVCYICNSTGKKYEKTDGEGYANWLKQRNTIVGGNYFRKTTRLLKFLRDYKDNFSVKSILLTTIIGNQIDESDSNSDEFSDLPTSLKILFNRVNNFLQENQCMPTICNPVLPEEDFNRHWDEKKYTNFRSKFNSYNTKINEAFEEEEDRNESVKKWRKLFGDNFGSLKESNQSSTAAGLGIGVIHSVGATKPYADYD